MFTDGDLYERSFETPAGRIDVLAEIAVVGRRLELRDIAVYPRGASRLHVSVAELLRWARLALDEISRFDFDEVQVTGTRLSGARPGRRVEITIPLRRE